jgi:hypothetical protein
MTTPDQLRAVNAHLEEALQLLRDAPDGTLHRLLDMACQETWEQLRQVQQGRTAPPEAAELARWGLTSI